MLQSRSRTWFVDLEDNSLFDEEGEEVDDEELKSDSLLTDEINSDLCTVLEGHPDGIF